MLLINILLFHLIFSCVNFLISEILLEAFHKKIVANGWMDTDEYKVFQFGKASEYTMFEYCLPMFIPVVNVLCTFDVIKLIGRKVKDD